MHGPPRDSSDRCRTLGRTIEPVSRDLFDDGLVTGACPVCGRDVSRTLAEIRTNPVTRCQVGHTWIQDSAGLDRMAHDLLDRSERRRPRLPEARPTRFARVHRAQLLVARTLIATARLARDGRIPRPLRWLVALGLLPIPGLFDEALLLLIAPMLWIFYRQPMREAWRGYVS